MEIPFIPNYTTTTYTIMGKNSQQSQISSNNNPLLSSIVTLYTLILLYFPQLFFNLIITPLFIPTLILLLTLLRLGASQQQQLSINPSNKGAHTPLQYQNHNDSNNNNNNNNNNDPKGMITFIPREASCYQFAGLQEGVKSSPKLGPEPNLVENDQSQGGGDIKVAKEECNNNEEKVMFLGRAQFEPGFSPNIFLEWDVGAPLEVIYEAFEGGEEEGEAQNKAFCSKNESSMKTGIIMDRYPSLSRYYPESDSDSDMDSDMDIDINMDTKFSYTMSFDEEEGKEGLIEIALNCDYDDDDYYYDKGIFNVIMKPNNNKIIDYEELNFDEEDNLIEIDISPTKNMS